MQDGVHVKFCLPDGPLLGMQVLSSDSVANDLQEIYVEY